MNRIVLAGGSGFLGRSLLGHFERLGVKIVVLSRERATPPAGSFERVHWDGVTLGSWTGRLEGADAVINFAGRSVDCRYDARNRRLILDSRVQSTRVLGEAIARCTQPPRAWLNASTATIYRHTFGPAWDESGEIAATPEAKDGFSIEVARAWERALAEAPTPATRKVALRTAMVFGAGSGGVFRVLRRLARIGLGGPMGGGRQYVSWIHEEDFCRAVEWLIERDRMDGAVNLASPNPLTNAEMMSMLRTACGVGFGLPAATWLLELGARLLRTETELIIKSRRVVPGRLLASGFPFRYPEFRAAVADLSRKASARCGQRLA